MNEIVQHFQYGRWFSLASSRNIAAVKEQLNRENEKFYEIGQLVARPEGKKRS